MNPLSTPASSAALSGATASGIAAIATGSRQLDQDAQQISNPYSPSVTRSLLDTQQSLHIVQAGADVISASNQMLGTLLDVRA